MICGASFIFDGCAQLISNTIGQCVSIFFRYEGLRYYTHI